MAFYKDVPDRKKPKTNYGDKGVWEEEGSRYNNGKPSAYGERKTYNRGEKSFHGGNSFGGEKKYGRSFGERSGSDFERKPAGRNGFEKKPFEKKPFDRKPYESKSFDRKPYDKNRFEGNSDRRGGFNRDRGFGVREEAPRKDTYQDFEYHSSAPVQAAPVEEENTGANILCGRNPIREALKSGRDIEKLLVQKGELSGSAMEIVQAAKEAHIVVQVVEKVRMDEIAQHHQGLIAYASAYQYSTVEEILEVAEAKNEAPFVILLDGITDPHNLGAIIRTAECVGAHGVIVPQRRSVGLTPAAVKASAGAVEHVRVARVVNINRTIDGLKEKNIWTYAVDMDGRDYLDVKFDGGVALVIGAEGEGISRLTQEHCDMVVSLPMAGQLDSLNASVAAGVMMYRVLACRK